jgi:hypothetical protein
MLQLESVLKGYAIKASDGNVGTASDFLFVDDTWRVRWLVVDTGTWWMERKVLIHPSAIVRVDHEAQELPVNLTRAQVSASPDILQDQPVSRQMETNLYDYYGWDPLWMGRYSGGAIASPLVSPPYFGAASIVETAAAASRSDEQDPHLRSIAELIGYHIAANDGAIGHIENLLIDDSSWDIRYLVVDTRNWWPGEHVLVSPYAVREISWSEHRIELNVARYKVKASPKWDPAARMNQAYQKRLHGHYQWPGYGW